MAIRNPPNLDRVLRQLDELIAEGQAPDEAEAAFELARGADGRISGARKGGRVLEVVRDDQGRAVRIEQVN